jgi:hypothetical protein
MEMPEDLNSNCLRVLYRSRRPAAPCQFDHQARTLQSVEDELRRVRTQAAVATRASMVTTSSSSSSSSASTSAALAAALEAAQLQLLHAQQDAQRQAAAYTMLEATCAALRADLDAARAQTAAVEAELESAHTAAASARIAMEKREALAVEAEAAQRTQALATAELTAQLEAANALIARRDAALVAAEIGMHFDF